MPVPGNAQGSYLTLRSVDGLIFGVINLIGNFATVFQDQAYWQRAIASRPATTVKAYLMGGLAWFAVPFAFSTTLGLAAVALGAVPAASSPTQVFGASGFVPLLQPLTQDEISAGLPASFAAAALLGQAGAAALLVVLFLAVTSATSAELIAVSSVLTYDVYVVSSFHAQHRKWLTCLTEIHKSSGYGTTSPTNESFRCTYCFCL